MSTSTRNGGFVMPVVLFALLIMGVMMTGGFLLARQESRISTATEHSALALNLAERGVAEVRMDWTQRTYNNMDLWTDTTITGSTPEGNWTVVVTRTDTTNFFAESTGVVTRGGAVLSGATRSVGRLLRIRFPELEPPAALATTGPLEVEGSADVAGIDTHPGGWGAECQGSLDKPGLLMNDTTSTSLSTGGQADFAGNPPKEQDATLTSDSLLTFGELDYWDLTAMAGKVYNGSVTITNTEPDSLLSGGVYECNTSLQSNWGDPLNPGATCFHYFPMIHIQGDLILNSSAAGQGILLIDGDVTLKGGYQFYGIMIARGVVLTEGTGGHINGGLIAANVNGAQGRAAGSSLAQYSSCAAARAIRNSQGASRPSALTLRSWVDLTNISY